MRKFWITAALTLLIVGGASLYVVFQHQYEMVETVIEIETPQGKLSGILTTPKDKNNSLGAVVFIHGDGPRDASYQGAYKPLWERLAKLGYASVSWSKPGIDGSDGNWLNQNMEDRAAEAEQVLAWLKEQPMIDPDRIGIWGASQAGWVVPKLAKDESIAFYMMVSPAINWLRQGEYHSRKQYERRNYSQAQTEFALVNERLVVRLLKEQGAYARYQAIAQKNTMMSEDRWHFVTLNYLSDATNELQQFQAPLLLLLGDQDINVDWEETKQVYESHVNSQYLHVEVLEQAEHSMMSPSVADSRWKPLLYSLFAPRQVVLPAYYEQIEQFLKQLP